MNETAAIVKREAFGGGALQRQKANGGAKALPFGKISMVPRTRYCVTFQPSTTMTGAAPPSDSTEYLAATSRFSPGKSVK